jgi:hypothetical protein
LVKLGITQLQDKPLLLAVLQQQERRDLMLLSLVAHKQAQLTWLLALAIQLLSLVVHKPLLLHWLKPLVTRHKAFRGLVLALLRGRELLLLTVVTFVMFLLNELKQNVLLLNELLPNKLLLHKQTAMLQGMYLLLVSVALR